MNLCIITSVIHTELPSIFDASKRLSQLLQTIKTVHEYIPDVYIVLIEGGPITEQERIQLETKVNCIYQKNVIGLEKSHGEATLLQSFFTSDIFKAIRPNIKTISKLSGRYELTEAFDFQAYDIRYYRFHVDNADYFIKKLEDVLKSVQYMDIEHAFYSNEVFAKGSMIHPDQLGVCGYNAPQGYLQVD